MTIETKWEEIFSVGNADIDRQHREFLDSVNALYLAIINFCSKEEVTQRLELIRDEALKHFKFEEDYLQSIKYPGLAHHKREHDAIIKKMNLCIEKTKNYQGKVRDIWAVRMKLELMDHMMLHDAEYAEFSRSHSGV